MKESYRGECPIGAFFSYFSKMIQMYFWFPTISAEPYRSVDIDDLILNTSGGILGYFLLRPFKSTLQEIFYPIKKKRDSSRD